MSNPPESPELPDLNRLEALARAATPGEWRWSGETLMAGNDQILWPRNVLNPVDGIELTWAERLGSCGLTTEVCAEANARLIEAMHPAAVLAIIALARRAQPEGEAPQAEPIGQVVMYPNYSTVIRWRDGITPPAGTLLYDHAPAAQHADSSAQAIPDLKRIRAEVDWGSGLTRLLEEYKHATDHGIMSRESVQARIIAYVLSQPALSAQSQGAQAAPGELPTWLDHKLFEWGNAVASGDAAHKTEARQAMISGIFHFRDAALAAKAEAPPLDDGEVARLRRVVRALGMDAEVPQDDATLRGCLFSVLGMIAGKLERGAQTAAPAPASGVLCVGVAAPKGATISVIQKKPDGTAVVLCCATLPAGDSMCSLNLGSFASFAKTAAAHDVLVERWRQVEAEGYDVGNDDSHVLGELGAYAAFYAMPPAARDWPAEETGYGATWGEAIVPADWTPPKPGDRRRELVKAGALVLAEIERMDRAAEKGGAS